MWSVEVGIQRRTEGHRELDFAVAVAVAVAVTVDLTSVFLISSAIFEQRIRAGFIKIPYSFYYILAFTIWRFHAFSIYRTGARATGLVHKKWKWNQLFVLQIFLEVFFFFLMKDLFTSLKLETC